MQADYVIVGAGSAGCVLANRLTEDPNNRVVVIEAGGTDWHPFIHIPAGYMKLLEHKQLTWGFKASFRAYITSSIANGAWTESGNASYTTPNFIWRGGTGTFDASATNGELKYKKFMNWTKATRSIKGGAKVRRLMI